MLADEAEGEAEAVRRDAVADAAGDVGGGGDAGGGEGVGGLAEAREGDHGVLVAVDEEDGGAGGDLGGEGVGVEEAAGEADDAGEGGLAAEAEWLRGELKV